MTDATDGSTRRDDAWSCSFCERPHSEDVQFMAGGFGGGAAICMPCAQTFTECGAPDGGPVRIASLRWVEHDAEFASLMAGRVEIAQISRGGASGAWFWTLRFCADDERASYGAPTREQAVAACIAHATKVLGMDAMRSTAALTHAETASRGSAARKGTEALVVVNGRELDMAQSMTVRVAIESLSMSMGEGLGDDEHGKAMSASYLARIEEIRRFLYAEVPGPGERAARAAAPERNHPWTPGPWEVEPGDDHEIVADAYPDRYPHIFPGDDTGRAVASIGNRTEDFGAANARLVSAAPDLALGLAGLLALLEDTGIDASDPRVAHARAALDKAGARVS